MMETFFHVDRVIIHVASAGTLGVSNGTLVVLSMLNHCLVVHGTARNEKVAADGTTLLALFEPLHDTIFMKGVWTDSTCREHDTVTLLVV